MAKKSSIINNEKKMRQITACRAKRLQLCSTLKNHFGDFYLATKVQKYLDRTMSHTKYRNRCKITGKPRGYIGTFGMCRNAFRYYSAFGLVMGVKKYNN